MYHSNGHMLTYFRRRETYIINFNIELHCSDKHHHIEKHKIASRDCIDGKYYMNTQFNMGPPISHSQ